MGNNDEIGSAGAPASDSIAISVFAQVNDLIRSSGPYQVRVSPDSRMCDFIRKEVSGSSGPISGEVRIINDSIIKVKLVLLKACSKLRVPLHEVFAALASFKGNTRVVFPEKDNHSEDSEYAVELSIEAKLLTQIRRAALVTELRAIDSLVEALASSLVNDDRLGDLINIAQRSVKNSILAMSSRVDLDIKNVIVMDDVGSKLVSNIGVGIDSASAMDIADFAQRRAIAAVYTNLPPLKLTAEAEQRTVIVTTSRDGDLKIMDTNKRG